MCVQMSQSSQSDVIVGISSATILDVRKTKFHFLESLSGRGNPTHQASAALSNLGYIDVEEDEYSEEVGWELLLLFHQLVSHSRDPTINLEVIRRIKSIIERFQSQLDRGRVQLVCDVAKMILHDGSLTRRSSVYLSGMALLKDLVMTLKAGSQGLHNLPQQVMRNLRSRDDVDSGPVEESRTKKIRMEKEEGAEFVGEGEEPKYARLMDQLLETDDMEKILDLEQKMVDLGYSPYVH